MFIVVVLPFFCEKVEAAVTTLDVDGTTQIGFRDLCIVRKDMHDSRVIPKVSEVTSDDVTTFVIEEQRSAVLTFFLNLFYSSKY